MKIAMLCVGLLLAGAMAGCETSQAGSGSTMSQVNAAQPKANDTGIKASGYLETGGTVGVR